MPDQRPPDAREMGIYFTLAQVGFEMVVPLIAGLIVDYYAGTGPWLAIAGIILGFVGGIAHIVVLSRQQEIRQREQKNQEGSPP